MGTNRDWETWGRNDPYFGVVSEDQYRAANLTAEGRENFFKTGEHYVDWLFETIRAHFEVDFNPDASLDFGCGVGRLLIPLSLRSNSAMGVDISPSMLAETRRNCKSNNRHNVELLRSDDDLSEVGGGFDLITSHIVLQHIRARRGTKIIAKLAEKIRPRGFLAVQFLYACSTPRVTRSLVKLRYWFPPANVLRNILRGRPLGEPPMQLNVYNLADIVGRLTQLGFSESLLITERFNHGEYDSVTLIGRRSAG